MICLTAFPSKEALLEALEAAGLASDGEHDQTCVDVFEVWPRKQVSGQWVDDLSKPVKWVANIQMDECPEPLIGYLDHPTHPRRVFA